MIWGSELVFALNGAIEHLEIFCQGSIKKNTRQLIKIFDQILNDQDIGPTLDLLQSAENLLVKLRREPVKSIAVMESLRKSMELVLELRTKLEQFAKREIKIKFTVLKPILLPILFERHLVSEMAMYML